MNRYAQAYQQVLLEAAAKAIAADLAMPGQHFLTAINSVRRDLDDLEIACRAIETGFAPAPPPVITGAVIVANPPAAAAPAAKPKRSRRPAQQVFDEIT